MALISFLFIIHHSIYRPRDDSKGPRDNSKGHRDDSKGPKDNSKGPRDDSKGPKDDSKGHRDDSKGPRDDSKGPLLTPCLHVLGELYIYFFKYSVIYHDTSRELQLSFNIIQTISS